MVVYVDSEAYEIYTIEGNSGDAVSTRIRSYGSIENGSEGIQGFCNNMGIYMGDIPEGIEFERVSGVSDSTR